MADQDVARIPLCERYAVADVDSHIIVIGGTLRCYLTETTPDNLEGSKC
jgi:hypothetical protein